MTHNNGTIFHSSANGSTMGSYISVKFIHSNMNNQSQFSSTEADAFVSFNDQIMSVVYLCLSLFIVVVVFKFSTPFQNHWTIFYHV